MIAQFLKDCGLHKCVSIDKLREIIRVHLKYNTLVTLYDDKGLYAVTRFNVSDKVAIVLDSAVREDRRGKKALADMIRVGRDYYPKLKYLKFERGLKNKPMKLVNIKKFLKEK